MRGSLRSAFLRILVKRRLYFAINGGAVLYYTSWWDFGGIEFEIGGIDPNCHHPKPRPTTPPDFVDSIDLQL